MFRTESSTQLFLAGLVLAIGLSAAHAKDEKAPETFQVKFETTAGDFVVDVTRKWSPNGADRFYTAVKNGFYDNCAFFRVVPEFVVQFGINGDPEVQAKWRDKTIKDDKVIESNKRGYVTFAKSSQPDSRTTQLFINLKDNSRLDSLGFSPFGRVTKGMDAVDKISSEHGQKPSQTQIQLKGNKYLKKNFPKLDYIKKASIVKGGK